MKIFNVLREGKMLTCYSKKIKEEITRWLKKEGWDYWDFIDVIEAVKIKAPVHLSDYNSKNNSFKCVAADGREFKIKLLEGQFFEGCSEIHIKEGDIVKHYVMSSKKDDSTKVPKLAFYGKQIKKFGKTLETFYCEFFINHILRIDETHILEIKIDEPDKYSEKGRIKVWKNHQIIEKYLMTLEPDADVEDIFRRIIEMLELPAEEVNKIDEAFVYKSEFIEEQEKVREAVIFSNGKKEVNKNIE